MNTQQDSTYIAFLKCKRRDNPSERRNVAQSDVHSLLFPFQRRIVQWALRKASAAIFADCGLGKTFMQLEWAKLLGVKTLIVAPLTVAKQTQDEAAKLGIKVEYSRDGSHSEFITVTNYEMIDNFATTDFDAVILDESSILKNIDGKTRIKLTEKFRNTPYKLCCTATPAPNDIAEIGNHAEFLNIMTTQEMLSMYFVHDGEWRLKGHAKQVFWKWVASWALFTHRPSDIGFENDGFELPPLNVSNIWIPYDLNAAAQAQGQLFWDGKIQGIQGRISIRRETMDAKINKAQNIVNASDAQWILWHGLNEEGQKLQNAIPDSVLVEGSQSPEEKQQLLQDFIDGNVRVLISKPTIAGFGLNLQNCWNQMFIGLSDSYEQYYQAVRRSWRFGQTQSVNAFILLTEAEKPIWENVMTKQEMHLETSQSVLDHIGEWQAQELGLAPPTTDGYSTDTIIHDEYILMLGDCVERMAEIDSDSVDFSVFSPPFLNLYVYSNSERDIGNNPSEEDFTEHFGYALQELMRVMKPGRIVACHVAQVPASKVHDGYIGLKDFHGITIQAFRDKGFIYHGEIVIDKDPQAQAVRTKAKGLLFVQLRKDSSWLRPGLSDYILLFRKPGDNQVPIQPDITNNEWIEWARPVWYNIRESDTLNAREARENDDERHIAPLQLGVIERCVKLWSNQGETVLSPFMGIGSEGYIALKHERRFIGIELKMAYYQAAIRNITHGLQSRAQLSMNLE